MKVEFENNIVYLKDCPYNQQYYLKHLHFNQFFYYNLKYYLIHRKDGPAVEWYDGTKQWLINGKRHREDGPAIQYNDGKKSYYLNNKLYSKEDYWRIINLKKKKEILESIL